MAKKRISVYIASIVVLITVALVPQRASAELLELALIIDGSSSISGPNGNDPGPDWGLQINAYRDIFRNSFHTTFIAPSQFDEGIAVAAYIFSGGNNETFTDGSGNVVNSNDIIVSSFLDWTLITNDTQASAFGDLFDGLPQPGGTTNTSGAIDIAVNGLLAANGGVVSCADSAKCFPVADPFTNPGEFSFNATGLLDNAFNGSRLVIDISTDGVPTEPNGDGNPNQLDRDLAIAAANDARTAGITVNAIGVGTDVDAAFLNALVDPTGFFVTADDFGEFEAALISKIGRETAVPVPAAVWLFGSGLLGLIGVARRRKS